MNPNSPAERSVGDLPTQMRSLGDLVTQAPDAAYESTLVLERLKDYQLVKELGRGAFGIVYLAHPTDQPEVQVALKVLQAPGRLDRLREEPALLAKLDHPCIVRVLDHFVIESDSQLVMALEYIGGGDLKEAIEQVERFPQDVVREFLLQIGSALAEAHSKGIVHRDLKPANILIDRSGSQTRYVLTDFGVGGEDRGIRSEKQLAGTLLFMAPEQLRGRPGPQSDLWALGVTAYRMLTGKYPFPGPTLPDLSKQIQLTTPRPPSQHVQEPMDPVLERVILKLLDRSETERIGSAKELLNELGFQGDIKSVLSHRPKTEISKRRLSLDERLRRGIRQEIIIIVLLIAVYILLVLGPGGAMSLAGFVVFYLAHARYEGWRKLALILTTFGLYAVGFLLGSCCSITAFLPVLIGYVSTIYDKETGSVLAGFLSITISILGFTVPILASAAYARMSRLRRERTLLQAASSGSPEEYLTTLRDEVQYRYEDVNFHLKYAEALEAQGKTRQSAVEARLILVQDPYHFNANLLLAQCYYKLGLYEDCAQVCKDYLKVSGYCFEFHELLQQTQGTLPGAST